MAGPNIEEINIVKHFRNEICDVEGSKEFTDIYCLSWLRARDLDIEKAVDMFRKNLEWRKDQDIDNVLDWEPPSHFLSDYDYEIVGEDDEGRPIMIAPFGEWDIRKAVSAGEAKAFIRYTDQLFAKIFEKTKENSKKRGKEVSQFVVIYDMANFSMRQLTSIATVNTILSVAGRFEANYPETLYSGYAVNAYRVFQILFSMLKPLLSPRTIGKIQIFTKPEKWQPVLLQNLPPTQLPKEFGGTRGGRRISIGHIPHRDRSFTERLSTTYITVEVGAGKKFELEFTVTQPQTRITWTFETDSYDIAFSINFNREEEVLPTKKCDSHINEEIGNFLCEKAGEYFVTFDNTYSKMRAKTVHYVIDILSPDEDYIKISTA